MIYIFLKSNVLHAVPLVECFWCAMKTQLRCLIYRFGGNCRLNIESFPESVPNIACTTLGTPRIIVGAVDRTANLGVLAPWTGWKEGRRWSAAVRAVHRAPRGGSELRGAEGCSRGRAPPGPHTPAQQELQQAAKKSVLLVVFSDDSYQAKVWELVVHSGELRKCWPSLCPLDKQNIGE